MVQSVWHASFIAHGMHSTVRQVELGRLSAVLDVLDHIACQMGCTLSI